MSFNPTSPVTGGAQTGLTSPTYTLTSMPAPIPNGKQFAVTALGGTQTGVTMHSVASPFTTTFIAPLVAKVLGVINSATGLLRSVPKNQYRVITRKGVTPLAGQPASVLLIDTTMSVPAGADLADPANVRAALALHIGALSQQSAGIGDTAVSGIM